MKKTVIYAVVLFAVALAAGVIIGTAVEKGKSMKQIHGKRFSPEAATQARRQAFDNLAQKLNLTAQQKEKVKKILEASREEIKSIAGKAGLADLREKIANIREGTNTKIKAVLTPEQQEEFEKMTSVLKQRGGMGRRFGPGSEAPAPMPQE